MKEFTIKNISGLSYDKEIIYFVSPYINALLAYNCRSEEVLVMAEFPKKLQMVGAFEKILKCDNKIFLFPCFADDIYYYDIEKGQYYNLNVASIVNDFPKRKVFEVVYFEGIVYCVCRIPHMVFCIDPKSCIVREFLAPSKMVLRGKKNEVEDRFFSLCVKERTIFYPYLDNFVVAFDIDSKLFAISNLSEDKVEMQKDVDNNIYQLVCGNFDDWWICNYKGEVFKVKDNKKIKITMPDDFIETFFDGRNIQPGINNMFFVNDTLCIMLRAEYRVLKYNVILEEFTWEGNNIIQNNVRGEQVIFLRTAQISRDTVLEYCRADGAVYIWNYYKGFIKKIEFNISMGKMAHNNVLKEYYIDYAASTSDLESLISFVREIDEDKIFECSNECGRRIYYAIKK